MYMVKCEEKYWPFVLFLRNKLRKCFFQQHIISKDEHEAFMEEWSRNYAVCIINDEPVGWVGCVRNDVRVAVHPDHQRKGVGKFMLNYLKAAFPEATAQIFSENVASQKLFESVGIKVIIK